MSASWEPILTFDSDEPEFARGFEAGRLWERIKTDQANFDETIHASNAEMVMRMCDREERGFRSEDLDDTYVQVYIS
jgi:hypothetical protein